MSMRFRHTYSKHYNTKQGLLTTVRDWFFTILTAVAFLSLFLALFFPSDCASGGCRRDSGTVFFVCSGSYTVSARAEERARRIQQLGGGGYIRYDGAYLVLSAAYVSDDDCESVLASLGSGHRGYSLNVRSYAAVREAINRFAGWYYALDSGTVGPDRLLPEIAGYAAAASFPELLSGEARERALEILRALPLLTEEDLSVNLKYYQCEIACLFAA